MPVKSCTTKNGKSGWKYGDSGKCYPGGDKAKQRAYIQFYAIKMSQKKRGKNVT